jgi:adenylyltransferase/sulfurtransferase
MQTNMNTTAHTDASTTERTDASAVHHANAVASERADINTTHAKQGSAERTDASAVIHAKQGSATHTNRYERQIALPPIGREGQKNIAAARIAVIGVGALGSTSASLLARAGAGFLRLIDRDCVSLSNLHRTGLFDEQDAAQSKPKALAAANHLAAVNSEVKWDARVIHANGENIEELLTGIDLVIDGSDNYELRFTLNEACDYLRIPWVYGGVLGTSGTVMPIIPGKTPCFRCLVSQLPTPGTYPTCATAGVLGAIPHIVASIQVTEGLKLLLGTPTSLMPRLLLFDAWNNEFEYIEAHQEPSCPTCGRHEYEYLGTHRGTTSISLCGRDEFQVLPAQKKQLDLSALAARLRAHGDVLLSPCVLTFDNTAIRFRLFEDGRMMLKGASSEDSALSLYAEFIGL